MSQLLLRAEKNPSLRARQPQRDGDLCGVRSQGLCSFFSAKANQVAARENRNVFEAVVEEYPVPKQYNTKAEGRHIALLAV